MGKKRVVKKRQKVRQKDKRKAINKFKTWNLYEKKYKKKKTEISLFAV